VGLCGLLLTCPLCMRAADGSAVLPVLREIELVLGDCQSWYFSLSRGKAEDMVGHRMGDH